MLRATIVVCFLAVASATYSSYGVGKSARSYYGKPSKVIKKIIHMPSIKMNKPSYMKYSKTTLGIPSSLYPKARPSYGKGKSVYSKPQPLYPKGQSVYTKARPVYRKARPVYPKKQQVYRKAQPVYPKAQPLYKKQESLYPKAQPVYPKMQPAYPKQLPIKPQQLPVKPTMEPIHSQGFGNPIHSHSQGFGKGFNVAENPIIDPGFDIAAGSPIVDPGIDISAGKPVVDPEFGLATGNPQLGHGFGVPADNPIVDHGFGMDANVGFGFGFDMARGIDQMAGGFVDPTGMASGHEAHMDHNFGISGPGFVDPTTGITVAEQPAGLNTIAFDSALGDHQGLVHNQGHQGHIV